MLGVHQAVNRTPKAWRFLVPFACATAPVTSALLVKPVSLPALPPPLFFWYHYWYRLSMADVEDILAKMRANPKSIRFNDLCKVCDTYFGEARQSGSSHRVYKTPWRGDPRVNIQNAKGKAKPYQVRQVLAAIERLEVKNG